MGMCCPSSAENKQPKMGMLGSLGTCGEMVNGKRNSKNKHTLARKKVKS